MKSTAAQNDHVLRLIADAIRPILQEADSEAVQAAVSSSSRVKEFQGGVSQLMVGFLNLNPYADEKAEPNTSYGYPSTTLPSVDEQIARQLAGIPGLSDIQAVKVEYRDASSVGTDGLMAIPFLTDLGRLLGIEDPLGAGYGTLGEKVLEGIDSTRRFYNYRKGELGSDYVRLNAEAREKLQALESKAAPEEGKLRFHILPVSMGKSLQGYSPRNALCTALLSNRLPLGFVQIGCTLLGWPERLTAYEQMFVDCPADEYNWDARGVWAYCPYFCFDDDELGLFAYDAVTAYEYYGSPVASLGV